MELTQNEIATIVGVLTQVQLVYKDSVNVNKIIDKLNSYITQPQPDEVTKIPVEGEVVK